MKIVGATYGTSLHKTFAERAAPQSLRSRGSKLREPFRETTKYKQPWP